MQTADMTSRDTSEAGRNHINVPPAKPSAFMGISVPHQWLPSRQLEFIETCRWRFRGTSTASVTVIKIQGIDLLVVHRTERKAGEHQATKQAYCKDQKTRMLVEGRQIPRFKSATMPELRVRGS